jgi:hypothetical protein
MKQSVVRCEEGLGAARPLLGEALSNPGGHRMTRQWMVVVGGLLFATSSALAKPGNGNSDPNLHVTAHPQNPDNNLTCPEPTACFTVTSDKNITHIFVDSSAEGCEVDNHNDPIESVTVDGEDIPSDKWHTNGGPCNHGEDLVPRVIWFPLTQNQDHAEVCVTVSGDVTQILVGAKSAEECTLDTQETNCCEEQPPCMGDP